jgi:hypothetical protein
MRSAGRWALVLALVAFAGRGHGHGTANVGPSIEAYGSEQEWLVDETARDIAEMCASARATSDDGVRRLALSVNGVRGRTQPPPAFDVNVRFSGAAAPLAARLEIRRYIWSPDDFAGLASELLAVRGLTATPAQPDDDEALLIALLEPRASTIQRLNLDVSRRLAADILSPDNHEAAALILATFSLREASGRYWNLRSTLCRIAAHLAMARALRHGGALGLDGAFAEAVLLTMSVRGKDAMDLITELEGRARNSEAQHSWLRALRLRNTHDWRLAEQISKPSLLERLEAYRARVDALGYSQALALLEREGPGSLSEIPDWGRIAMELRLSVDAGHRFSAEAVDADLAETAAVWATFLGHDSIPGDWVPVLNERHTRCLAPGPDGHLSPQVLSWGAWAAFLQRQLCNDLEARWSFMDQYLGLPKDAKDVAAKHDRAFGQLTLYPYIRMWRTHGKDPSEFLKASETALERAGRSPELLTFVLYTYLREKAAVRIKAPNEVLWFKPPLLTGVAYEGAFRLRNAMALRNAPLSVAAGLRALAPDSAYVVGEYLERRKGHVSVQERRAVYGRLLDYDRRSMIDFYMAANLDSPEWSPDCVAVLQKLCALDADSCSMLGSYMAARRHATEATDAYQRMFDHAVDRVGAANGCSWLVHRYLDQGQTGKALQIARQAAAVYSAGGLAILGQALERSGDFKGAESYYRRIAERYDDEGDIAGFCFRQARTRGQKGFEPELLRFLAKASPKGLEKLDRSTLPARPTDGVRLDTESVFSQSAGLMAGDVIVALDGWRVRSTEEYQIIRHFTWSAQMTFMVWSHGAYREVTAATPNHRLNVDITTYTGK